VRRRLGVATGRLPDMAAEGRAEIAAVAVGRQEPKYLYAVATSRALSVHPDDAELPFLSQEAGHAGRQLGQDAANEEMAAASRADLTRSTSVPTRPGDPR